MPRFTAVFLDIHGVLIDGAALQEPYAAAQAAFSAEHFGGAVEDWLEANRDVVRCRGDLLADLDFRGPDGVRHRGVFERRAWEMMFRRVGLPVPDVDFEAMVCAEAHRFTRESDALYPDAREPLVRLAEGGLALHAISDACAGHIRGCLEGAEVAHLFAGVHGYDNLNLGLKQPEYYRRAFTRAGLPASEALCVEDSPDCVLFACEAGAAAVMVRRGERARPGPGSASARAAEAALAVLEDMAGLTGVLDGGAQAGG